MEIYTIGVYGSTEQQFFNKLVENNIDTFCDIRQRRGVRGSEYAFVNSQRLQNRLAEMGIQYDYLKDLAPTKEIRDKQKEADKLAGIQKKDRTRLGDVFIDGYKRHIVDYDFGTLVENSLYSGFITGRSYTDPRSVYVLTNSGSLSGVTDCTIIAIASSQNRSQTRLIAAPLTEIFYEPEIRFRLEKISILYSL